MTRPECQLANTDGNAFAVIGNVSRTLTKAGLKDQAAEFKAKAFKQDSYDDLLRLCFEYVEVT